MLILGPSAALLNTTSMYIASVNNKNKTAPPVIKNSSTPTRYLSSIAIGLLSAAALVVSAAGAIETPPQLSETLSNIPQELSSECTASAAKDCNKPRIQKPKSRKAESCTIKCVTTCIRGGEGSPGEGPLNVRR
ncbi:hypothetical protein CFOL_v3_11944 [Cephalotus follicularis]|uniref:Uncharacterized protein n=1 Tax=Cephalotus follicularis TaxID=3775 RepID=A0A1Q3BKB0_CEPFO|nr:hypothetical protein CFOL_v3_11944 [Cephalotus follicularis]